MAQNPYREWHDSIDYIGSGWDRHQSDLIAEAPGLSGPVLDELLRRAFAQGYMKAEEDRREPECRGKEQAFDEGQRAGRMEGETAARKAFDRYETSTVLLLLDEDFKRVLLDDRMKKHTRGLVERIQSRVQQAHRAIQKEINGPEIPF